MLFMVWSDTGSCIRAYCVPDSFSTQSSLNIFVDGTLIKTIAPNEINEHVLNSGRHQTGHVGFTIDETILTGLSNFSDLEIRDVDTDILVYRRPPAHPVILKNIFRLETHLLPLSRLDQVFKDRFRFWYERMDRFAAETARQILSFDGFGSCYSSGRILYNNYRLYIEDKHKVAMLMRDPYDELAERLLIFSQLGPNAARLLGDRDALVFGPAQTLVAQCRTFSEGELRQILNKADPDVLNILSNPITRQLTCATPGGMPDRGSLAKSLQVISGFDLVGLRNESRHFTDAFAELLEVNSANIPNASEFPRVVEIGKNLRAIRWLEALVEKDLELFYHVKAAYEAYTPDEDLVARLNSGTKP
jgi:hypothetical protein